MKAWIIVREPSTYSRVMQGHKKCRIYTDRFKGSVVYFDKDLAWHERDTLQSAAIGRMSYNDALTNSALVERFGVREVDIPGDFEIVSETYT